VSQWEAGISTPEIKKLIELRSKLNFSLDWLIAGEGELTLGSLDAVANPEERRQDDRRRGGRCDRRQHQRREGSILNNTR
jgi:transcriptional regulator with XRE-family HTH domain